MTRVLGSVVVGDCLPQPRGKNPQTGNESGAHITGCFRLELFDDKKAAFPLHQGHNGGFAFTGNGGVRLPMPRLAAVVRPGGPLFYHDPVGNTDAPFVPSRRPEEGPEERLNAAFWNEAAMPAFSCSDPAGAAGPVRICSNWLITAVFNPE